MSQWRLTVIDLPPFRGMTRARPDHAHPRGTQVVAFVLGRRIGLSMTSRKWGRRCCGRDAKPTVGAGDGLGRPVAMRDTIALCILMFGLRTMMGGYRA